MSVSHFWNGVGKCAPIALSSIPFGVAFGLSAVEIGMSPFEVSSMSMVIFAGASQMAAVELVKTGASPGIVLAVVVAINLRFALYSAALAGWVKKEGALRRGVLAYLLTDQAFAVTTLEIAEGRFDGNVDVGVNSNLDDEASDSLGPSAKVESQNPLVSFYFGAGIMLWVAWQLGTLLGALVGNWVPTHLGIELVAPLVFGGLATLTLRDGVDVAAAFSSVVFFLLAQDLPAGLSLIGAATVGIFVGIVLRKNRGSTS